MILLLAFAFLISAASDAHSAPLAAAIAAFASTTIGGIIVNIVIGVALSVGASLIKNLFNKPDDKKDPGTTIQLRVGGDNPLFFPMGYCATGGVRIYSGTWGYPNGTPNEFGVDVIAFSSLPVASLESVWLNDQRCTLDTDGFNELGFPLLEYRRNGIDYAWVRFHLGDQTTTDPYLLDRFASRADYPWQSDMIGRGVAYAIVTCRYDTTGIWAGGFPSILIETSGIRMYNPALDSTIGGFGTHRWGDYSTYEPSNNFMVHAYNVARGIRYDGEWVYGGQNWAAFRLPSSSWIAGISACNFFVDGEPQFHGGGVVEGDVEPARVIEELLRSSSGLISEIGGILKIRIGAPGAPVYAFNDDNVVVTREQGYDPFPGLESTYNIVRLSYTEPVEKFSTKESPERRNATFIAADDGRELPMSVTLPWVWSNTTAQRIGLTALLNGRRFRQHKQYLPPEAFILEPLDVVAWTSAHNSYVAKSFDLEQISSSSSLLQGIVIREVDPSDFNWNPATDRIDYQTIPLTPDYPAPQAMVGWQVFPDVIYDNNGVPRRPTIRVHYGAGLTDIDRVRVQVRLAGAASPMFDGEIPYDNVSLDPSTVLAGQFTPDTNYEVRGILIPYSDRVTEWSAWLPVTTGNVLLQPGLDFDPYSGVTDFDQLGPGLAGYQDWIGGGIREIERRLEELDTLLSDQDLGNETDRQAIRQQLTATYEHSRAEWRYDVTVVATATEAVAQRVETLEAEVNDPATGLAATASAVNTLTAYAGPGGTLASSLTTLDAQVNHPTTGLPATASAVTGLEASVTTINGNLVAQAQAITSLSAASTSGQINEANFRMQVVTGPTGYSRIGGQGRVGGAGSWRTAGWYVDVPNNAAQPTRFVVQANQFVVASSGTDLGTNPLVFEGGTLYLGGGVRARWAQIEDVTIGWADIDNAVINNLTINDGMIPAGVITATGSGTSTLTSTNYTWPLEYYIHSNSGLPAVAFAALNASFVITNTSGVPQSATFYGYFTCVETGVTQPLFVPFTADVPGASATIGVNGTTFIMGNPGYPRTLSFRVTMSVTLSNTAQMAIHSSTTGTVQGYGFCPRH